VITKPEKKKKIIKKFDDFTSYTNAHSPKPKSVSG